MIIQFNILGKNSLNALFNQKAKQKKLPNGGECSFVLAA